MTMEDTLQLKATIAPTSKVKTSRINQKKKNSQISKTTRQLAANQVGSQAEFLQAETHKAIHPATFIQQNQNPNTLSRYIQKKRSLHPQNQNQQNNHNQQSINLQVVDEQEQ